MASTEEGERADTIVVGTDGSESAASAVREAARLTRMTGARLVIVSTFSDVHPDREHIETSGREALINLGAVADQVLMRAAAEADGDDIEMETVSRQGDPARVLADVATQGNARLIIVGDRGQRGVERVLLGSVSHKVSRQAPCSVLIPAGRPGSGDTGVGHGHGVRAAADMVIRCQPPIAASRARTTRACRCARAGSSARASLTTAFTWSLDP